MAFFNGSGGAGDATTDSTSQAIAAVEAAAQAAASATAADASATAAAASAAASAASASTASSAADSALTQASNAFTYANEANSYLTQVTEQATLADSYAVEASTSASSASGYADLAQDWAIKTSSAVSGGEYSAKYHANAAATSASDAADSASNAYTSEINAAQSAIDAASIIPSQTGNSGKFLTTDGTDVSWATVSGTGTVTSVDMSVPTGLAISGNPVTTSGTLALTYASGYSIPTTTKQTNWDTAYGWGNHASAGYLTSVSTLDNLGDVVITSPSNGQVLKYNGTNWINDTDATGSGGGGSGTVTSVAMTVPTGLTVTGSPITTSGTLAVSLTSGYSIPTTSSQTNWDTAYGWGNHASAGYLTSSTASSTYQPLDADLTAIAGLAGTSGFLKKTAANTWSLDTSTHLTSSDIGSTVQAYDADLTSWAAITPSSKQDALVSGTNIKTINGGSVLGSGNITTGDASGPASATDNAITRYDGTTGKLIQNSGVFVDDLGNVVLGSSVAATTYGSKIVQIDGTTSALVFKDTTATYGNGYVQYDGAGNIYMGIDGTVYNVEIDVPGDKIRLITPAGGLSITPTSLSVVTSTGNLSLTGRVLAVNSSSGTTGQALIQNTSTGTTWGDVVTPTGSATLTNKTISADDNTLSGIAASSFVLSNASGNIDGSAAQKAIPTGVVVGTTDTQTLTNKTLTSPVLTTASTSGTFTFGGAFDETVFAVTGTTPALSPSNGTIQTWTLSASSTPTAGTWNEGESMTIMVLDGTAFTINWTSVAVTWVGGSAPTLDTTKYTVIELWKVGTTIYGALVGAA